MTWIGTVEAAARLGVEPRVVYRLIDTGKLSAARGKRPLPRIVVDAEQVDAMAAESA